MCHCHTALIWLLFDRLLMGWLLTLQDVLEDHRALDRRCSCSLGSSGKLHISFLAAGSWFGISKATLVASMRKTTHGSFVQPPLYTHSTTKMLTLALFSHYLPGCYQHNERELNWIILLLCATAFFMWKGIYFWRSKILFSCRLHMWARTLENSCTKVR